MSLQRDLTNVKKNTNISLLFDFYFCNLLYKSQFYLPITLYFSLYITLYFNPSHSNSLLLSFSVHITLSFSHSLSHYHTLFHSSLSLTLALYPSHRLSVSFSLPITLYRIPSHYYFLSLPLSFSLSISV